MTKNLLWAIIILGVLGTERGHTQFVSSCKTPDGTWKDNCSSRYTLTQDSRGCTLIASCNGKDTSYMWNLSTGTPSIDYMNGALINPDEKKACAA